MVIRLQTMKLANHLSYIYYHWSIIFIFCMLLYTKYMCICFIHIMHRILVLDAARWRLLEILHGL